MKIGKLPNSVLNKIVIEPISKNNKKREEVIISPKVGEDCSVINLGEEYCVLSTDPITGASNNIGNLAVNINCNDIASSGAEVVGIMITALLPPQITEDEISKILTEICTEAGKNNIAILGGHTEITDAVNRPVISCTVIGKTKGRKFISSSGAKVGQDVIMTKWAGLEGSSIIANDFEKELTKKVDSKIIEKCKGFSEMLSVMKEAEICSDFGATCMHDITEGGVLGGCREIAECSEKGIEVYLDKIPVFEETKILCNAVGVNYLRLISSGSLLVTAENGQKLIQILKDNGINAEIIGKIRKSGFYVVENGKMSELGDVEVDELYNVKI